MDITYLSLGMPFDGDTVKERSLGGSESACYYQARELVRRGHKVSVFTATQKKREVYDGVTYCSVGAMTQAEPFGSAFEFYARNSPQDVLVLQRIPAGFHRRYQSKINLWQTHDLALRRYAGQVQHGLWQVDAVTCVSEWHRQQTLEVYGVAPEFVRVVPNGVDLALYEDDGTQAVPEVVSEVFADKQFVMLYQARPERGMEHLVRPGGIMSRLLKEAPNACLIIVGYDNTQAGMAEAYEIWFRMARQLPNVRVLGALSKPALAQLQKACDLMIYPTEFEEVSCISAMEAMAAGLPLLSSECGALPETCKDSGALLLPLKDGRADEDRFVEVILGATSVPRDRAVRSTEVAKTKTWSVAVDALERVIEECFERRRGTRAAQLRHCVEHGDIMLARELADAPERFGLDPIEDSSRVELGALYRFTASKDAFAAHYRKHQGKYYDEFEDKVVGEDVTATTRYRGVESYLSMLEKPGVSLRMMDYGCAHGHYLMPIAKQLKDWRFVGVDISARAIAAAMRWAQRDGLGNVELVIGDDEALRDLKNLCPLVEVGQEVADGGAQPEPVYARDLFDVILAGEVLEHTPDPVGLLNLFTTILRPGGTIIGTTPVGRWEWSGHEAFKTGREHLWHFERADLEEMCAGQDLDISVAPAGSDETGAVMGSLVFAVVWDGTPAPFKDYDRARKLARLAPRETITAALIVKDGERTLRKCLDSVAGWVDEVVVGIDAATTDTTRAVIERWQEANPWTPTCVFDGAVALRDGFAAARNRTLEACHGDWVLWFDADEEVQRASELWKLARPSPVAAFGLPQVHYAFDPPQVLTTDFPCRFFRRAGVEFHGLVHEHPEREIGKAIPYSMIRHDTQFLHSGYTDERTRRARFLRNLPLLQREQHESPERGLNRFLWLRDLAQGIGFELEQTGGRLLEGHLERARAGVALYEELVEKDTPRMIIEAAQYYSHCVCVLGGGFEAEVGTGAKCELAPDLTAHWSLKGRFHSREFFFKVVRKILEESTKFYEDKYI